MYFPTSYLFIFVLPLIAALPNSDSNNQSKRDTVPYTATYLTQASATYALQPPSKQTNIITNSGINYCSSPQKCTWVRIDDSQNACKSLDTRYHTFIPDSGVVCHVWGNDKCNKNRIDGVKSDNGDVLVDSTTDPRSVSAQLTNGVMSYKCAKTK